MISSVPAKYWRTPLDSEKIVRPQAEIHLIRDQCKGCGFCIEYCPRKVLEESDEINARGVHPPKVVAADKCMNCGFCTVVCPDFAIFVTEKEKKEEKKNA